MCGGSCSGSSIGPLGPVQSQINDLYHKVNATSAVLQSALGAAVFKTDPYAVVTDGNGDIGLVDAAPWPGIGDLLLADYIDDYENPCARRNGPW